MDGHGFADIVQWSSLVGFALPWLVAVIKQSGFSARTNSVLAFGCCVVAATLTAIVRGDLTWETWGTAVIAVFVAAQTSYKGLWQKVGEPEFEHATSVVKATTLTTSDTGEKDPGGLTTP